jgi:hypothetical protein
MNDVLVTGTIVEYFGLKTSMLPMADAVYQDRVFIGVATDTAAIQIIAGWFALQVAMLR